MMILFCLLLAIESSSVKLLTSTYKNTSQDGNTKVLIIEKLMKDQNIKCKWNVLTEDIDFPEEEEYHLLKEIISLWVTIRGFSLAATWLETYKQSASKNTIKS